MGKKILLVYTSFNSFVKSDYDILSSAHQVDKFHFSATKKFWTIAVQLIRQFVFLLFHIWKYDVVFIWFGDYHSFLPVLFSKLTAKKSIIVIGGYDVTSLPEFKYGSLYKPIRRLATYVSFRYASLCLPVVEKLEEKLIEFCPKAKSKTIYTGYKFDIQNLPNLDTDREKTILTVSITNSEQRVFIKGLDRFRELAQKMPDFDFIIIGVDELAIKYFNPVPENLTLIPPLNQHELISYYLKSSYYAQFSRTEGLPNALCEGMLYGCIPLGMDIGGIPTAIGNYGLVSKKWIPHDMNTYIRNTHNVVNRNNISRHIIEKFDITFRINKLLKTISD